MIRPAISFGGRLTSHHSWTTTCLLDSPGGLPVAAAPGTSFAPQSNAYRPRSNVRKIIFFGMFVDAQLIQNLPESFRISHFFLLLGTWNESPQHKFCSKYSIVFLKSISIQIGQSISSFMCRDVSALLFFVGGLKRQTLARMILGSKHWSSAGPFHKMKALLGIWEALGKNEDTAI